MNIHHLAEGLTTVEPWWSPLPHTPGSDTYCPFSTPGSFLLLILLAPAWLSCWPSSLSPLPSEVVHGQRCHPVSGFWFPLARLCSFILNLLAPTRSWKKNQAPRFCLLFWHVLWCPGEDSELSVASPWLVTTFRSSCPIKFLRPQCFIIPAS